MEKHIKLSNLLFDWNEYWLKNDESDESYLACSKWIYSLNNLHSIDGFDLCLMLKKHWNCNSTTELVNLLHNYQF